LVASADAHEGELLDAFRPGRYLDAL
jgi:hypothetical protein